MMKMVEEVAIGKKRVVILDPIRDEEGEDFICLRTLIYRGEKVGATMGKEAHDFIVQNKDGLPHTWRPFTIVFPTYERSGSIATVQWLERGSRFPWGGKNWVPRTDWFSVYYLRRAVFKWYVLVRTGIE